MLHSYVNFRSPNKTSYYETQMLGQISNFCLKYELPFEFSERVLTILLKYGYMKLNISIRVNLN